MTAGQCGAASCAKPARTRGYCETHYRRRLHTGRYGYRDAAPARAHIARLRQLGWTYEAIARAAGLSIWVGHKLHSGTSRRLLAESEVAILRVPLIPFESHRGVSAVGARRRVQALAYMGWPNHEIARRIGCSPRSLPTLLSRGRLSAKLSHRIAAVYDELSMRCGPSKLAAVRARGYGWAPPLAWDDDEIDNPAAEPQHNVTGPAELAPCGTRAAHRRHIRRGEPIDQACRLANRRREDAV